MVEDGRIQLTIVDEVDNIDHFLLWLTIINFV